MASVPLSLTELETIAADIAQELLEDWAINDRAINEDAVKAAQDAISDTILVINSFMEKMNNAMDEKAREQRIIN
jgi:hypothetical protein